MRNFPNFAKDQTAICCLLDMTEKKGGSGPRLDVVISAGKEEEEEDKEEKEEEEEEEEEVAWSPSCLPLPASSYPACKCCCSTRDRKSGLPSSFSQTPQAADLCKTGKTFEDKAS